MKKYGLAVAFVLSMNAGHAAVVEHSFSAQVGELNYGYGGIYKPLNGLFASVLDVKVGDVLTGTFSYDTDLVNVSPFEPELGYGYYFGDRGTNHITLKLNGVDVVPKLAPCPSCLFKTELGTLTDNGVSFPPPAESFSLNQYILWNTPYTSVSLSFVFNHRINGSDLPARFDFGDVETGYLSLNSSGSFLSARVTSMQTIGAAVPEAGSMAMAAAGLAVAGLWASRRKRGS